MSRIVECITQEHDFWLLLIAVLVCVAGSCLSVMVSRRLRNGSPQLQRIQSILSGLLSGATIWSTHFIAMLAYDPGVEHGYAPILTGVSFVVAIFGMFGVNVVYMMRKTFVTALGAGILFGGVVAAMHYVGMQAFMVPGQVNFDPAIKTLSIVVGTALAVAAYHRIAYPVTKYCWIGGSVLMALSICSLHLLGMSAVSIELSPLVVVPAQVISDEALGFLVFGVTAIILAVGFAALSIETKMEHETMVKLAHTASHDHLTGVPNRVWLAHWFENVMSDAHKAGHHSLAVLVVDLDRFKEINDLRGHLVGDHVLKVVANRLQNVCQNDEVIARTGGDEFTAAKTDFGDFSEVLDFARRLQTVMDVPIEGADYSTIVGGSIGLATGTTDRDIVDDLMQKADFAMYRAKASGDTAICVYDAEMDNQYREKLLLIHDLRDAVANDQFELVYQLQHDLSALAPVGCEALLRWRHPSRGMIPPDAFIPIAEETGFICEIGHWVLRAACLEATTWVEPLSLAVNVAPQQLVEPSFLENLSDVLMESRLAPERLELEVTEASVISDQNFTLEIINKVKAMGVRIAMDDFGTGYSSLATLQQFPFDKIKIDRSFVTDVHTNPQRAAIVRATLLLGSSLDIPVLAEGVEEKEELDFLKAEGCTFVQGYYFGKPLAVEDMRDVANKKARRVA